MRTLRWGDIATLRYGKGLREYPSSRSESHSFRVFGTNGPIGWHSKPLVNAPGIIVGRKGAYRGVHFSSAPFYVIDTAYYLDVTDPNVDLKWAYYKLLTVDINRMDSGSAIPSTSRSDFDAIVVQVPEKSVQQRITQILAAYDDLIENNRRRTELLEASARHLYEEWFVRLRFPGHEQTNIVNGVPEGWERRKLIELCDSVDYGYTASADSNEVGPRFLRITDIVPQFIDWSQVPFCPIEDERLQKFRLQPGDIVIARTGATVGFAKQLHQRLPDSVFASYLVRLRPSALVNHLIMGVYVESDSYKEYVRSNISGSAQPNANAQVLAAAEMLVPTSSIQAMFGEFVQPLFEQREVISSQSMKLKQARDLLLPRLMSGEVAV